MNAMEKKANKIRILANENPELTMQWHPIKNGDLTPNDFTIGSQEEVWWLYPYDDPKTGKHFDFEWEEKIKIRNRSMSCPFLFRKRIWRGFNDLFTTNPKLAEQWHPVKNGDLTPYDVSAGSNQEVWWSYPYDDPKTGKHYDFEWEEKISIRNRGTGCPYLSGRKVWRGFNDLFTINPTLAEQWHPVKNGDLTPFDVTARSGKKFWWLYAYDDPKTEKNFDFDWEESLDARSQGPVYPHLSGKRVWRGFNDLFTINPTLAEQWHPVKNGDLTPYDFTIGSKEKVWWLYPYDDPKTGKHFDFEWPASIKKRNSGDGCPYLIGRRVFRGFNDFESNHPELASQWHPTKNGNIKPYEVAKQSNKMFWWLYPYDDPKTGKHFDFEWPASCGERVKYPKCPFLESRRLWPGYNDLESNNPELALQWHPTKNGGITPKSIAKLSNKKVWWMYPYDDPRTGKHFDFEWEAEVANRQVEPGCPYLSGKRTWPGFNDLFTINPKLASQWHPLKNGDLTPYDVTASSGKRVWWMYPYDDPETGKHFDFEWKSAISNRNGLGRGCPFTEGNRAWSGYNDLETHNPDLAKQWHPTKNGNLRPSDVTTKSEKKVWWLYPYDDLKTGKHFDFEWKAVIATRQSSPGCPILSGKIVWKGYNDLETVDPLLSMEWNTEKNRSKNPSTTYCDSNKKYWWKCGNCGHEWRASVAKRRTGSNCSKCHYYNF